MYHPCPTAVFGLHDLWRGFMAALFFHFDKPMMIPSTYGVTPILKKMLPGFQRINDKTMHVVKLPGLNPQGDNIALLHGVAASASSWLPLVKALLPIAKSFLLFDLPGHGLSPSAPKQFNCMDAYRCAESCLLKNLDPEDPNLIIGNSLGGAFTVKFCMEHPDYAARCVLISPAGAPFPGSAREIISPFLAKSLADARQIVEHVWTNPPKVAYLLAPLIRMTTAQPGFISLMESIMKIDEDPNGELAQMLFTQNQLADFKTPALFIWGKKDRILPSQMCAYYDAHLPDSVTRYFPDNLGHCPQFEAPKEIADEIMTWRKNLV